MATYPLDRKTIASLPDHDAVYVLKHTPTGKLYIGHTGNLRKRALHWFYSIVSPQTYGKAPPRMLEIIQGPEHNVDQWTLTILEESLPSPAGLAFKDRPENKAILQLQ